MTDHYADEPCPTASAESGMGAPSRRILTLTFATPYSNAMRTADIITDKLTKAFAPESLQVVDESHLHEGHAGHRPGGQTHFRLHIVAAAFQGKSRLECHRMVNAVLAAELAGGVHALAIHAAAPETAP